MNGPAAAALALVLLAAGCVTVTVEPGPTVPRYAQPDTCVTPWPYVVDERRREADGDGVRIELFVATRDDVPRPLASLAYALSWGRDPGHVEASSGTLADLAEGRGWALHDEDGVLDASDRFVGRVPGARVEDAHWTLDLRDASGAFVGGAPRCA